jgi:hypothetical protein
MDSDLLQHNVHELLEQSLCQNLLSLVQHLPSRTSQMKNLRLLGALVFQSSFAPSTDACPRSKVAYTERDE